MKNKLTKSLLATLVLSASLTTISQTVYANEQEQFQQAFKAFENGNYQKAFELFSPLAEQGDAAAQYNLGVMYLNG